MLANRALVKLHRLIPRAVDVTDYRIIDQFQLNHRSSDSSYSSDSTVLDSVIKIEYLPYNIHNKLFSFYFGK